MRKENINAKNNKNTDRHENKIRKHKKVLPAVLLAAVGIIGTAAASSAYWTDMISLEQEVSAMTIGVKYDSQSLGLNNADAYLPGESRDLSFKVINSGDISVDIKPVITITSSKDMKKGGSEFIIADASGNEIEDYTKTCYTESGTALSSDNVDSGSAYRKIEYRLTDEKTLAGSRQKEASEGETSAEQQFGYKLVMSKNTGNDYKGAIASVDVSTYAIQHRNRDEGDDWISIAGKK